jgi:hypothetical protein
MGIGVLFLSGVKLTIPPSSVEVKNSEAMPLVPGVRLYGMVLN